MVKKAIELINELQPSKGWIIENPRGMLRKQSFMQELPRRTITYCQYG
ncbi:MAG: DNA cytosine methyltransferase, partial [Betaproteobacteria bacterium]|nr:DNA cytosine methyltransferase [Betaproteobacteria bacterium]